MTSHPSLILQVGTPRTASTTLQRHVLPRTRSILALYKKAYSRCIHDSGLGTAIDGGLTKLSPTDFLASLSKIQASQPHQQATMLGEGFSLIIAAARISCAPGKSALFSHLALQYALAIYRDLALSQGPGAPLVVAAERLSNHDFAITSQTGFIRSAITIPAVRIVEAWKAIHAGMEPKVRLSACLREPIPHLASRYLRCNVSRRSNGLRPLTVDEYVDRHVWVHRRHPFASALFPVIHREFIRYHKPLGEVYAFGFRALLRSEDVFSLMGIPEQEPLAFASLPHENQAAINREDRHSLEAGIMSALDRNGYLRIVNDNQLFE